MQRTSWLVLALATALGSCAPTANPPLPHATQQERPAEERDANARRSLDDLLELMRQRLLVQHAVARYKWHAQLSILDAKREQRLLEKVEVQARDAGLEPDLVRTFFQAQMQAGKLVQQGDFDSWRRGDTMPPDTGPDLMTLRQRIDSLNRRLLQALKEAGSSRRKVSRKLIETRAEVILQGKGITAEVRRATCAPLLGS